MTKKLSLALLFLFVGRMAVAQSYFNRLTDGGGYRHNWSKLLVLPDGNILMGGTDSMPTFTKINPATGAVMWNKRFDELPGIYMLSELASMEYTTTGKIISGGIYYTENISSGNYYSTYFALHDTAGNVIWQLQNDDDDSYGGYITEINPGQYAAQSMEYTATQYFHTRWMTIDEAGNITNKKAISLDNNLYMEMQCLHKIVSGNYITTGFVGEFGNPYGRDIILAELDTNFNVVWNKIYRDTVVDYALDVFPMSDGGYMSFNIGVYPLYGTTVIRTDAVGAIQWAQYYGDGATSTSERFTPRSVTRTADNSFLVSGIYTNNSGSNVQGWVMKMDTAGAVLWSNIYTDMGFRPVWAALELGSNLFFAGGLYGIDVSASTPCFRTPIPVVVQNYQPIISDTSYTLTVQSFTESFSVLSTVMVPHNITITDGCLGAGIAETGNAVVAGYPNPANDYIQFNFESAVTTVELFTTVGKSVYINNQPSASVSIPVKDFEEGLYIASFTTGNQQRFCKVMVRH